MAALRKIAAFLVFAFGSGSCAAAQEPYPVAAFFAEGQSVCVEVANAGSVWEFSQSTDWELADASSTISASHYLDQRFAAGNGMSFEQAAQHWSASGPEDIFALFTKDLQGHRLYLSVRKEMRDSRDDYFVLDCQLFDIAASKVHFDRNELVTLAGQTPRDSRNLVASLDERGPVLTPVSEVEIPQVEIPNLPGRLRPERELAAGPAPSEPVEQRQAIGPITWRPGLSAQSTITSIEFIDFVYERPAEILTYFDQFRFSNPNGAPLRSATGD